MAFRSILFVFLVIAGSASAFEVGSDSLMKQSASCTKHLRFTGGENSCEEIEHATKDDAAVVGNSGVSAALSDTKACAREVCGSSAELATKLSVLANECAGWGKFAKGLKGVMVSHGSNQVREKTLLITVTCKPVKGNIGGGAERATAAP